MARGSSPRCLAAFALALASLAPGRGAAAADALPAVARPRLPATTGGETGAGTVFFLELPSGDVAAVGAAHSFDLRELAAAPEVEFRLGRTGVPVARSQRFLAPPGRPFTDPRGSLREDVVVFALEAPPQGARSLAAAEPGEARSGERVRILGVPAMVPQDEDDLFGRLVRVDATRLEVDLDVKADLRGWGGAPVLAAKSGRVLGILEAALPSSGTLRLGVAPIQAALDAAAAPLEAGRGAPFAAFAPEPAPAPPPGAETAAEERGEEDLEREPEFASGGATDTADFERAESDLEHRVVEAASAAARAGAPRETEVQIELEHPDDGAVFDSAAGAFLAGRALAQRGDFKRFDVALVLDTSGSTAEATGVDVNGNGIVGASGIRGLFRNGDDPGDSILAAEVLAALRLLERFDPRNVRVSVISFSGSPPAGSGGGVVISLGPGPVPSAVTEVPLTGDFDEVGRALFRVLQRGPYGGTHIAAGLDQATIELLGLRGSISEPDPKTEKVVVFLTDGLPSLPTGVESYDVRACLRAAERARRAGVKVHTFAIGPEALSGPMATVEMARRTGGAFTPVRNPADIVSMIEGVSLVDLSEVRVRNLTTGKDAGELELRLDGGFAALLDLAPGRNRIEVYARASDGSEARREITLQYAPGAPLPEVPPSLVATKNLLLERRLTTLKQVGLGIERTQAERTRGELALAIQRERQQAEERAAAQRRELRIDVEAEPPSGGAPAPEATP